MIAPEAVIERDGGFWVVKKEESDCHKDAIHFPPIPKDAMSICVECFVASVL